MTQESKKGEGDNITKAPDKIPQLEQSGRKNEQSGGRGIVTEAGGEL